MSRFEYLCFSCGTHFAVTTSDKNCGDGQTCPHCSSVSTIKLDPNSFFTSLGGG